MAQQLEVVYLSKGVHATTGIEGNTLSEEQVRQQIEKSLKLPPSQQYLQQEVQNIIDACGGIVSELGHHTTIAITSERIKQLNSLVLRGLPNEAEVIPGDFRKHSVGVMGYRGAPWQDCEYPVGRLCDWLNGPDFRSDDSNMKFALVLLKSVIAHLYVAWIHPFGDGNGRTARLVEFLIMGRSGLVAFPSAHLLSNHYNKTRSRYYTELDRSSKTEDGPIKFFEYAVEGFVDGLREQVRYIRDQQIQVTWESHIHEQFCDKNSLSSKRQKHLLLDMPVEYTSKKNLLNVSPRVAREYASKSEKTLTRDLDSLKRMRLIVRSGTSYRPNREAILAFLPPRLA
jgi:Fic family protein